MEVTRIYARAKRYNRLLIHIGMYFFFLCSVYVYSQDTTQLQFSQKKDFSVLTNSEFSLELKDVSPSEIELITRRFPSGVSFVSSSKNDDFIHENGRRTQKITLITYTLKFANEGVYNLGSLPVMINSELRSIQFPEVRVYPNIQELIPELHIENISPLHHLQEGYFTISARYAKKIEDIQIGLSENALIGKKEDLLLLPSTEYDFTSNTLPLVTYFCTPFSTGTFILPEITAIILGYNGNRYEVQLKETSVSVLSSEGVELAQYGMERALESDVLIQSETLTTERKEGLVQDLISLRRKEKYSLFPFLAKQEREEAEKKESIQNIGEVSYTWVMISLVFSGVLFFVGFCIHVIAKKKGITNKAGYAFVVAIFLCIGTVIFGRTLVNEYALTYGAQLYTIPEYESKVITSLYAGQRVEVHSTASDWYLVSLDDGRTGWIQKTDCVFIDN